MFRIKVPNISDKELLAVRKKFEESATAVGEHKELNHFMVGTYVGYYYPLFIDGRKFIVAPSRVFNVILEEVLPTVVQEKPEKFGIYNAYAILEEMHSIDPVMENLNRFIEWLSHDKYAYVFEVKNEEVVGEILRLQLFSKIDIDKRKKERSVFTGGIFHAFKHFSYNSIPLSTQPSKNEISHPRDIIEIVIKAFFLNNLTQIEYPKPGVESHFEYNGKRFYSVFYLEKETKHYYLNSMRRA